MPDVPANSSTTAIFDGIALGGAIYKNYGGRFETVGDTDWIALDVVQGLTYDLLASANKGLVDFEPRIRIVGPTGLIYASTTTDLGADVSLTSFVAQYTGRIYVSAAMVGQPTFMGGSDYSITALSRQSTLVYTPLTTGNDVYDEAAIQPTNTNVLLLGGSGNDVFTLVQINRVDGGAGDDSIAGRDRADALAGGTGNDTIIGGDGNDILWGDTGNDRLEGDYGADQLWGGDGDDDLNGFSFQIIGVDYDGNDTMWGGEGNDIIRSGPNSLLIGGPGNDTYSLADYDAYTIVDESVAGSGGVDEIRSANSIDLQSADFRGNIENAVLFEGINDDDSPVSVQGNALGNRLTGNSQKNLIDGRGGADAMAGLAGNDTYRVDHAGDVVTEAAGQGTDVVYATVSYALGANQSVETLQLDASTGSQALNITGNNIGNVLTGNAGANVLNGGSGADLMQGGSGNDSYVVDNAGDVVKENAGGGTDTVVSLVSYALAAGQSIDVLQFGSAVGSASLNLTGNNLGNTIFGNVGSNALQGLGGADNIIGGGGRDIIAPGSDTAVDTVHFNAIADSTGGNRDQVLSADFNNEDKLVFAVKNIAYVGAVTVGALNNGANFNIEIGNAVNGLLNAGGAVEAVLFDPNSGGLNQAGHTYLVVDANNDGSYTANADYLVELVNFTGVLDSTDFI